MHLTEQDKKALWCPIPQWPEAKAPSRAETPAKRIRLFVQTYTPANEQRAKELSYCLRQNKALSFLEVVELPAHDRLTFREFFAKANETADADTISVFANSDIRFDQTLALARWMAPGDAWCLSRWRTDTMAFDGRQREGQRTPLGADAWCMRGKIRPVEDCDFGMGVSFCDYAIAARLRRAGYALRNPAWSIRTWHHHASNHRTYHGMANIPRPWVSLVPPSSLNGWAEDASMSTMEKAAKLAGKLASAPVRMAAAVVAPVSPEDYETRKSICAGCDKAELDDTGRPMRCGKFRDILKVTGGCSCGCSLLGTAGKIRSPLADCPLGKWPKR